jgi:hypothetical protein
MNLPGIPATDLHALNTALGAAIEDQVVRMLNVLRKAWDPNNAYPNHAFIRYPQTFPDVRLTEPSGQNTLFGFDLKGWYVLAKEGEPSLRFKTTESACHPADWVVVVPWVLSNVLSGSPILYEPCVISAKFAADFRNYYWRHGRGSGVNTTITQPPVAAPHSGTNRGKINDKPAEDSGNNFGRLARVGLKTLDEHIDKLGELQLCGIRIEHWRKFFGIFKEGISEVEANSELDKLKIKIQPQLTTPNSRAEAVRRILAELELLLTPESPPT